MLFYAKEDESKAQFENIFKLYFKSLCFYAMSFVKDKEIARDIVHDIFYNIWKCRDKIDYQKPMYPYLVSLTRNHAINYIEHLKVKDKYVLRQQIMEEVNESTNDAAHEELIRDIINRIDQMPERCREVMQLCFVECKKQKEIAEKLGISINTVKTHIASGLKILRSEFPNSYLLFLLVRSGVIVKK